MAVVVVCIPSVHALWIDIQAVVQLLRYKMVAWVDHGCALAVDMVVGIVVGLVAGKE